MRTHGPTSGQVRTHRTSMVMSRYRPAIPRYAVTPNSFRSMRVLARALNHRALAAVCSIDRVTGTVTLRTVSSPIKARPFTPSERNVMTGYRSVSRRRSERTWSSRCPFPVRKLDTDRYPVITFRSDGVNGLALIGELTVRNVTVPVTLSIEQTTARARWFDARASTRIDRNEFGVTAYRGMAGRYLDMTIEVRCVRT